MKPMIIPTERMNDEILYSYVCRLVGINGFVSLPRFMNYVLGRDIYSGTGYMRYDSFQYLGKLFSMIDGLDWQRFFMDTTIYPLIAPLLLRRKQADIVNTCFIQKDALRFIPNSFIHHLKICPECRKEMNEKYGFWWYKKSQNLPLVTTCEKHACRLELYNGTRGHELEYEEFQPLEGNANPDFDKFIRELSNAELDCSLEDIMPEMIKAIDDRGIKETEKLLNERGLNEIYDGSISYARSEQLSKSKALNWQKALILLYICFDSVKNIPVPAYDKDDINEFFLESQGYKVFKPFRRSLIEMEHEACGTRFLTTVQGFIDGWACPLCQSYLSDNELFKTIIDISGAGEYKLIGNFTSLKNRVEIKHLACGQTLNPKARNAIFERLTCQCTTKLSRDEAQERARPMKLIRFSGTESNATFRCPDCGQTFTIRYRAFLRHPHCHICGNYKAPALTTREFKKKLKDLVGDEYILIGEYKNSTDKVTLLHKKCGKTFKVSPVDFFQGTRCSNCLDTKYMREDEFKRFVHEVSLGIYEAETEPMSKECTITDTRTGKQIKMTRIAVMQELRRPTPSPKLPLQEKGNYEFMSRPARLKQYITDNYRHGEIIFTEDIRDKFEIENFDMYPRKLANEGFLKNLSPGAFCFADDDISLDEYIRQKYIERKGHHIGFVYGNELAYNLGIIDEKPPYHMVITNKESQTHGRRTNALGTVIKVKGSSFTITDKNWELLQMVNLIESSYRFGWPVDKVILNFMNRTGYTENDFKKYIRKPHIFKKLRRIIEDDRT